LLALDRRVQQVVICDSLRLERMLTLLTATWLLIYLGTNPEWKAKAAAEVNDLLADQLFPPDQKYSLSAHLAMIPLETWESETPILDSLIRETLRIAQPHTAMRRNTGPDISIGDRIVPAGSYVVYPFSDIHLNERYYPNPWRFDPGRNHDSKIWMGFGRGSSFNLFVFLPHTNSIVLGNVTCMGMRLAKLELKLVISMMLLGFRHSVVNEAGLPPSPGFHPDWNDYMGCRPSKEAIFVKYERTDVPL
jgi:cytochrome P450